MVQFKGVSKLYKSSEDKIPAVDDVSFKINEGEFVFLIGPSGSGKTTVIKMLIRDETPSQGNIFFNDRDITQISRKYVYKLRREIGVIFQDYKLVPEKTAFENVSFAMEAAGKTDKEIYDTVPYVLDIVGLSHKIHSFPKELSGGEQQRVAIARAIANNPKILIADEPTGNLDPASSWDIVQILNKINNWGTTVIMSTHGTDIVNSLNKRVIQMEDGKIIRDDSKGQYEMVSHYENKVVEKAEEIESNSRRKKKNIFEFKMDTQPKVEIERNEVEPMKSKFKLFSFFSSNKLEPEVKKNLSQSVVHEFDKTIPNKSSGLHVEFGVSAPLVAVDKHKPEDDVETLLEETQNFIDSIEKSKKENEQKDESSNQNENEMLDKFSNMLISDLKLDKTIEKKFKKAKIIKITDIIEEGPEMLEEKFGLTEKEVLKVAKAIERVVK